MEVNVEVKGIFKEKVEKIKNHLIEHKEAYIAGGIGLVAGIIGTIIVMSRRDSVESSLETTMVPQMNLNKCEIENSTLLQQTITYMGNVVGRPGNEVMELDTGKVFKSQTLAALHAGVSNDAMFKHLQGEYDNLNGRHFARIDDMQAIMPDFANN